MRPPASTTTEPVWNASSVTPHARLWQPAACRLPRPYADSQMNYKERTALPITLCDCGKNFEQIVDLT